MVQSLAHQFFVRMLVEVFEDIAGLAFEHTADLFEGGEADGFGFSAFEHAEVGDSDIDFVTELGQCHFAFGQHDIQVDYDRHEEGAS